MPRLSNSTYVCLDCRTSARRWNFQKPPVCPDCQKPMVCVGKRWRIPKKDSDGSWRLLRAKIEKALHEGHDPWYYL
jgi:hypothetical protein